MIGEYKAKTPHIMPILQYSIYQCMLEAFERFHVFSFLFCQDVIGDDESNPPEIMPVLQCMLDEVRQAHSMDAVRNLIGIIHSLQFTHLFIFCPCSAAITVYPWSAHSGHL